MFGHIFSGYFVWNLALRPQKCYLQLRFLQWPLILGLDEKWIWVANCLTAQTLRTWFPFLANRPAIPFLSFSCVSKTMKSCQRHQRSLLELMVCHIEWRGSEFGKIRTGYNMVVASFGRHALCIWFVDDPSPNQSWKKRPFSSTHRRTFRELAALTSPAP